MSHAAYKKIAVAGVRTLYYSSYINSPNALYRLPVYSARPSSKSSTNLDSSKSPFLFASPVPKTSLRASRLPKSTSGPSTRSQKLLPAKMLLFPP